MKNHAYALFIYGLLILGGGITGYAKAQSLPSLMMGILFGVLLLMSGYAMLKNKILGYFCALGFTGFLILFFSYRFYGTQKFMPAGLMTILSIAMMILLLSLKRKKISAT